MSDAPKMPEDFWLHVRGCDCAYCTWKRANGGDALHRAAQEWHAEQGRVQLCRYGRNTTSLRTQPCNCAPDACRLGRTP